MKDLKYSRQREAILDNLKSRVDHPTADMLFQSLRKDDPKISLGTVYRNLGLLTEIGKIRKLSDINGVERYDYNTTDHYHFACKACSKLIDLPTGIIAGLDEKAKHEDIGIVENHSLIFYGYCKECYQKMIYMDSKKAV